MIILDCQFTLIAEIPIAECPIAEIPIAKSPIAKILIAECPIAKWVAWMVSLAYDRLG